MKFQRRSRALTLVEVVVVLGVAVAIAAIVIPLIAQVRRGVGDVGCQNNLRQLLQALEMYNLDHNGSMPYGVYFGGSTSLTREPPPDGDNEFISWASELNRYFGNPKGLSTSFRCPVALQQAPPHLLSYVMNMIVAIDPPAELLIATPPTAQLRPPKIHLMRAEGTALIWDTGIRPNWSSSLGHIVGYDIDNQRFWRGAETPQFRYYAPQDPFNIPPGTFGNNRPILLNVSSFVFFNKDPDVSSVERFPYQGNLRFRHNKHTQCNVAFSDGSVRQFTAVINPNNTVASHDAIRKHFMIHWPPGVPPNPAQPSLEDPGGGGGMPAVRKPMAAREHAPGKGCSSEQTD